MDTPVKRSDSQPITDEQKGTLHFFVVRTYSAFGSSPFQPADVMVWAKNPAEAIQKLAAYWDDQLVGTCRCTIIEGADQTQLKVDHFDSGSRQYFRTAQPGTFTILE